MQSRYRSYFFRERMQSSSLHINVENDQYFFITRERLADILQFQTNSAEYEPPTIDNVVSALRSNVDVGILADPRDLHLRRQVFGSNLSSQPPPPPPHSFRYIKHLFFNALRDSTFHLIFCCAMLSLAIGIKTNGAAEGVIDGVLVFLAISFVVCFGTVVRFFKARWMLRRSTLSRKMEVWVVRNGMAYEILESELVVGDIVWLQTGDRVPADGLLINGDSFQLNGEDHSLQSQHPSLFTGSKVVKGRCRMVVTAVGDNTERSRLVNSINITQSDRLHPFDDIEQTSSKLEKIWLSLSLIILVVQFIRCFVTKPVHPADKDRNFDTKGVKNTMEDLMKETIHLMKKERALKAKISLVTMLCVLLFAARDGSSLAVFITLLCASNRMKSAGAIVQQLQASAALGSIDTVCACDLALHRAKMANLWIGSDLVVDHGQVDREVVDALRQGILVHSRVNESRVEEISLVTWARAVLGLDTDHHHEYEVVFDDDDDFSLSCSIMKRRRDHKEIFVHWKGCPGLILPMCSHYFTVHGEVETLDANKTTALLQIVNNVGCCFAFANKRLTEEDGNENEDGGGIQLESDLTLLGFVCLKNPYPREVIEAIEDCRKSGVEIKLIVDDDINVARIMAVNSGILKEGDDDDGIFEAVDFRSCSSDSERMTMVDNIHVMANASPADKLLMLQCLRQKRRVVAAAASAIRDSPLLREADVGIFIGGDQDYNADIIVPTNSISRIPGILNLGRRVCRSLEKFMQLQLTMEISAFTINIICIAATGKEALGSFEVLWTNLVMDILGAVAVAITTIETRGSWNPVYGSGRIINRGMWRSVAVQALFQVVVIVMMEMKGKTLFHVNDSALGTMVFNCYAFCQLFMLIPAIELQKNDVVAGLLERKSCLFIGIVAVVGVLQVAVVEIVGAVAHRPRLEVKEWCISIGIASFSLPLNCAANWIPTS